MTEAALKSNVTEFRAECLTLFREPEARRYDKLVVTRRGKANRRILDCAAPGHVDAIAC